MSGLCGHAPLTSGPMSTCQVCLVLALALLLACQPRGVGSGRLDLSGTSVRGHSKPVPRGVSGRGAESVQGRPGALGGLTPVSSAHVAQPNPWGIKEQLLCPLSSWGYGARWWPAVGIPRACLGGLWGSRKGSQRRGAGWAGRGCSGQGGGPEPGQGTRPVRKDVLGSTARLTSRPEYSRSDLRNELRGLEAGSGQGVA